MVKAMNSTTIRRFEGVIRETGERAAIKLENSSNGVLNGLRFETNNRPVYNYVYNNGLDTELAKGKIAGFCERLKDGAKLFKEIMEAGLNLKK